MLKEINCNKRFRIQNRTTYLNEIENKRKERISTYMLHHLLPSTQTDNFLGNIFILKDLPIFHQQPHSKSYQSIPLPKTMLLKEKREQSKCIPPPKIKTFHSTILYIETLNYMYLVQYTHPVEQQPEIPTL